MMTQKKFPIFGLISIAFAFIGSLPLMVLVVLAFLSEFYAFKETDAFFNNSRNNLLLGVVALAMLAILAIGVICGLIGIFREKGNKIYAVGGVSFNVLILLTIGALMLLGIYSES